MSHVGKVFISHSSADKGFVERLVADLAARQIPVWYDKLDLRIGESIPGSINRGLADSKYFAIVLSKAAVASKWVQEELNAATMTQVARGGTFLLPILIEDCQVPPLLAHRKFADFRSDYDSALADLLALWGKDSAACSAAAKTSVYPWPDIDMEETEFIYLHSTRFDKFFRASCSLGWTVDRTIDYLTKTLDLPWNVEVAAVGMKWSFSYSIKLDGKKLPLHETLGASGVKVGSVVQIGISGLYEDLYEKELKEAFSGERMYLETMERMERERWLRQQVAQRRLLRQDDLKKIADSCFSHV